MTLLAIRKDAAASVTIAEFTHSGELRYLEATGAADGRAGGLSIEPSRLRPATASSLGWWIPRETVGREGLAALLREGDQAEHWKTGPSARRWAALGFADLIVAMVPIGAPDSMRMLAVEFAVGPDEPTLDSSEALVLQATLGELAHRAALAFGLEASNPLNRVTPREQMILEQLALGKTVKQIAELLARSPHTVHDHVKSLHRKLNVSSRGELIARALGHIEPRGRQISQATSAGNWAPVAMVNVSPAIARSA